MFKILVPIDFSPESEKAFLFAVTFAKKLKEAEIILFHALMIRGLTPRMVKDLEDVLHRDTNQELDKWIKNAKVGLKSKIRFTKKVAFDDPVHSIIDNSQKNKADLILMGSRGTGKTAKLIFGSNAIKVLENSSCPVLLIPKDADIHDIKHIVYASDLVNFRNESKIMTELARLLDASLHIIHVYPEIMGPQMFNENKILEDLKSELKYDKITFLAYMNSNIINGIKNYLQEIKPDIIALYIKHRNMFEKLFDSSIAREMAIETKIPLLALPHSQ